MALLKRESGEREPLDMFTQFDKMFDEWMRSWPFSRGVVETRWPSLAHDVIRVDEFRENSTLVVRAELPGIDPDEDVELTVSEGMLHITGRRRAEEKERARATCAVSSGTAASPARFHCPRVSRVGRHGRLPGRDSGDPDQAA